MTEIDVQVTPREDNMLEIRLELTGDVQLQDVIEFAELARRYGDKTQRGVVQPTEGNRQRQMLVFRPQHSKINTEPAPAKRTGPRVVGYVEPEDRKRRAEERLKLHKNSATNRSYYHGERD